MKLLLIFDSNTKVKSLSFFMKNRGAKEIVFFPLTQDMTVVDEVKKGFISMQYQNINILNSAKTIDEHFTKLRNEIVKWSAGLGDSSAGNKTVKEWFMLKRYKTSAWWLTLLSEKSNWKTNAFLEMAQVNAIKDVMAGDHYFRCAVSVSSKPLRQAILSAGKNAGIDIDILSNGYPSDMKSFANLLINNAGMSGHLLHGLFVFIRFCIYGFIVRRHLGNYRNHLPLAGSLLFVSYFPSVDKEASREGYFRNKYALALQGKLKELQIPVTWLLLYARIDGFTYRGAARLADSFAKKGENLYMLEEFVTIRGILICLLLWLKQIALGVYLFHRIERSSLFAAPVGRENEPVVKALWQKSFCGSTGMEGLVYLSAFDELFSKIKNINDCIYYCEMQAWEKALNAASKQRKEDIRRIGFRHSTISVNEFHYFYDKSELDSNSKTGGLPLPDILVCPGETTYSLLKKSGYKNLAIAESVRYMYIGDILSLPYNPRTGKPILLIAGSFDRTITKGILSLVAKAFPKAEDFDIWFKAHPATPFESLFEETGIDIKSAGYTIHHDNISEYLAKAWSVLVPTGAVAIEAMAYGCEVIVPVFPDTVCMNPLVGFEDYYHKVTFPDELTRVVKKINCGYSLHKRDDYQKFISRYWVLDQELPRWTEILQDKKKSFFVKPGETKL